MNKIEPLTIQGYAVAQVTETGNAVQFNATLFAGGMIPELHAWLARLLYGDEAAAKCPNTGVPREFCTCHLCKR